MPRSTSSLIIITAMLSLIVLSTFAIASADPDPVNSQSDFSIKHGTKALQFQLGSAFSQRNDGYLTIAGKYYLSPKTALQLGINFGAYFENHNEEHDYTSEPDTSDNNRQVDRDRDGQHIGLALQYIKYYQIENGLNFFWGAGPAANFSHSKEHWDRDLIDNQTSNTVISGNAWEAGIKTTIGAEVFIKRRISLYADYGFFAYYYNSSNDNKMHSSSDNVGSVDSYEGDAFNIQMLSTNIGITVYF